MTSQRAPGAGVAHASTAAVPLLDRFADVQAPLLSPLLRASTPSLLGLGYYGVLLALLSCWLLLHPLRQLPPWPAPWQVDVGLALLLLGATGCLERHLITLQKHVRRQGQLAHYRRLKRLSRRPLLLATAVAASLLAMLVAACEKPPPLAWRTTAIRVVMGFEVGALAAMVAQYAATLLRLPQSLPDADTASCAGAPLRPLLPTLRTPSVGPISAQLSSPHVVDRQAEVLRFQEERLRHLGAEVLRLQDALAGGGRRGSLWGGPQQPQEEVEEWVAMREQELRNVGAERDVLAREVCSVRSVLVEAQAEAARLRSATKQHAEENARLRAMRDEWSARSAKLEQTLLKLQVD